MAVEARFYVAEVGKTPAGGKVILKASTKGPNNWSVYTPSGEITMSIVNTEAMPWFEERLGTDVRILIDDVPTSE